MHACKPAVVASLCSSDNQPPSTWCIDSFYYTVMYIILILDDNLERMMRWDMYQRDGRCKCYIVDKATTTTTTVVLKRMISLPMAPVYRLYWLHQLYSGTGHEAGDNEWMSVHEMKYMFRKHALTASLVESNTLDRFARRMHMEDVFSCFIFIWLWMYLMFVICLHPSSFILS